METPRYFNPEKERCLIRAAKQGVAWARDELILGCLPFVAKALHRSYPAVADTDLEDLLQEAIVPLYDAIERYDLDHPARARLYVFAMPPIRAAVSNYFRHHKLLSYSDNPPELLADDDPHQDAEAAQNTRIVRQALARLSDRDRDVLCSRLGSDRPTSRRELAERHACPPHVIEYAERRALDRFIAALCAIDPCADPISIH